MGYSYQKINYLCVSKALLEQDSVNVNENVLPLKMCEPRQSLC